MNFLQNVQNGACTPRLRGTRVITERPVLVRQLGESRPRIIADVSSRCPKNVVDVVQSVRWVLMIYNKYDIQKQM
jgi:hypothetical protein